MRIHYCLAAAILLAPQLTFAQPATPVVRIQALNRELIRLSRQSRESATNSVREVLRLRLAAFRELAENDPAGALTLLLPEANLAPLRAFPPEIVANLESDGQWSGPADVVAEDDFEHHTSRTRVSILVDGEWLPVYSADAPADLQSGVIIRATGTRLAGFILSRNVRVVRKVASTGCSSTGVQHLAVVMVNFKSSSINTTTVNSSSLGAIVSGGAHSLTAYWNEASYGQTSAAGDVFGPYNLGADYTSSDYNTIRDAAIAAAANTGHVNFQSYTHVIIIMPNGFPVGGGLGTIGCSSLTSPTTGAFTAGVVWIRADFVVPNDLGVCAFAHEDGHNLGLDHASTESYGGVPLGSFGTVPVHDEYGSFFSLMSQCFTYNGTTLLGHYDAQHKVALGWYTPANYQTVTANGTFVLAPTETASSNLHAIRVQRGVGGNFWLWLEYRQAAGYDGTFSAFDGQIYSGAMIHFEDPANTTYIGYTRLLNYTAPSKADFSEPALAVSSTWSDPYSLLTLKVTSADSAGLHITVQYDTPCVSFTPTSRTYNSAAAVSADTVALTAASSCSWTGTSNASWITVTGTASGSGSGTLTYSLAANTAPSARTGTITIGRQSFTITQASGNPQPTPVSVSPKGSSSVAGTSQTFVMTYSDASGAGSLAEVHVLFNSSTSPVAACDVTWLRSDNTVRLADDGVDGGYSYWYANQSGTFSNSQCALFFSNAIVSSGNNLTLTLTVTFTASFLGAKNIYLEAQDSLGADSGMVSLGTWTVLTSAAPALSIVEGHTGNFRPGQIGATYSVAVSNGAGVGSTSGMVTVTETIPTGLTLVSMAGTGWTCPGGTICTRSNPLAAGGSYPAITVTVNVAAAAPASVTNQVKVSGGGSATAQATDPTTISTFGACDLNQDSSTNVADVQKEINEALGVASAANDLNRDGGVNVADVQIVINAALGLGCSGS